MNFSLILRAQVKLTLVLSLLSGCGYSGVGKDDTIEFPALPIIQRAVDSLVPRFDGQRNNTVMDVVCALARGRLAQDQVPQVMRGQGVDLSNIPPQGHALSVLVNDDLAPKISACAAYVATSVMIIPNLNEITEKLKSDMDGTVKAAKIDPTKLDQLLGRRLAIAKTNSDVYALIARELKKEPGKTLVQYDERAKQLFKKIAPVYLQRVKTFAEGEQGQRYILEELTDNSFKFSSDSGYKFELGYGGIYLEFNRMLWFGGRVMVGQVHQLKVNYFEPALLFFHEAK